jgi:hypothetical protein
MLPIPFLVVLLSLVLSVTLRASDAPLGDQHASALNKEFDTLNTAYGLYVQMVEEGRPDEEVVHSLDVVADELEQFYARLAQFAMWLKVVPNAAEAFSDSGRA